MTTLSPKVAFSRALFYWKKATWDCRRAPSDDQYFSKCSGWDCGSGGKDGTEGGGVGTIQSVLNKKKDKDGGWS
jgi:hypothetical protein